MKLLERINTLLLLEYGNHVDRLSFALLEAIRVKRVSLSKANNSLLAHVDFGGVCKLGNVRDCFRLDTTFDGGDQALVSVVLDQGFHLVISVKVDWVSCERNLILLVNMMSKAFDNKLDLNAPVRCKDICAVNLVDLEVPGSNNNYLLFQICNVDV